MEKDEISESVEKYFDIDPKKDNALINILNPNESCADCIVLNIGSSSIKFGVASQLEPFMVPNVIAYHREGRRIEEESKTRDTKHNPAVESIINSVESDLRRKLYLLIDPKMIKSQMNNLMGFKLFEESNCIENHFSMAMDDGEDDMARFENQLFSDIPEDYLCNKDFTFTKVSKLNPQKYFIGEEALSLHKNESYELFKPIRNGYLNVTHSTPAPICLDALELILKKSITEKLRIPEKNFKHFRCVITVPDLVNKKQLKHFANLILKRLGLKSIFMYQESVLATFGTATNYACVVDIGAEKINIACVEDGTIIPETIVRKNFGGDDLTNLLYDLLHRKKSLHYFPKDILNKDYPYHWNLVNKFKEIYCRWILGEREIIKRCTFWVHEKGDVPKKEITVNCSDCLQVTILSVFYPELIEAVKKDQDFHMLKNIDLYDFDFDPKEQEEGVDDMVQMLVEPLFCRQLMNLKKDEGEDQNPSKRSSKELIEAMYKFATLEEMICDSIMSITVPETRNKMASKILLTGGLVCAKEYIDLVDIIEDRMIHTITQIDKSIEKVDVIQVKDQDPRFFSWIGGSVFPRLETSKDMFIDREYWTCEPKQTLDQAEIEKAKKLAKKKAEEAKEFDDMKADAKVFAEPLKPTAKAS
ncbi:unnamed protein product [Moneuplotes crassus]|uniref:Actin-related protein 8 n=1 Tax=Euplotes crassus TaxID=5936 RepID=A0AAD1X7I7_EUPCR|nr:unnamed protein product [Moneuplotes crassus]